MIFFQTLLLPDTLPPGTAYSRLAEVEAWSHEGAAPARVNVAESLNGAVASSSSNYNDGGHFIYTAAGANNGVRSGAGWGRVKGGTMGRREIVFLSGCR